MPAKRGLFRYCVTKKIIGGVNSVINPYSKPNFFVLLTYTGVNVFLFKVMYVCIYTLKVTDVCFLPFTNGFWGLALAAILRYGYLISVPTYSPCAVSLRSPERVIECTCLGSQLTRREIVHESVLQHARDTGVTSYQTTHLHLLTTRGVKPNGA